MYAVINAAYLVIPCSCFFVFWLFTLMLFMIIAVFGHWSVIHFLHLLQDAICTLNTLQTNASALEQVRRERGHPQLQLQAMTGFLERAGLTVSYSYHLTSQARQECYIRGPQA